jgi:phosphoglucosamine mutase
MTTPLFGTDGMRARFGEPPLDRETVIQLVRHLARCQAVLPQAARQAVVGGDTRYSTAEIAAWIAAALAAEGVRMRWAGVVPTPAVAHLTVELGAEVGIAVSASHNPWHDNGIKLVDSAGFKWTSTAEAELERRIEKPLPELAARPAGHDAMPQVEPELGGLYVQHLAARWDANEPLAGLRLVLDTANGAASPWAPSLFRSLGASVTTVCDHPDGRNINLDCGSTHPHNAGRATLAAGADIGLTFDGDADRVLLIDEHGGVRDGDEMLYLWALRLVERGELDPPRVVATSMSNFGLTRALARHGVEVVRCEVGDRAVVATMRREGILLGGEQSGHLVHLGLSATGDGMLTGLALAAEIASARRPVSDLLAEFRRYPQVLENVRVVAKPPLETLPAVADEVATIRRLLGRDGRLVLRYSGTEPLARVMIEGPEMATVEALAQRLARVIRLEIGEEAAR